MLLPVIMAGGSGSRLWPLSRSSFPKQFINLASDKSMLQETLSRLSSLEHHAPLLLCNQEHRFLVAEQLRKQNLPHSGIILEPTGRNTAPAIALAALYAIQNGDDPLLLVLASDHTIKNETKFISAINDAISAADQGMLVTFGIVPTSAETGYGYIKQGEAVSGSAYKVERFVEKPDPKTAQDYVKSKQYLWNSGMFMFKASRYLDELKIHRPDILEFCKSSMKGARQDLDFIRVDEKVFAECPGQSIDYAVMENTRDAIVVPMDADWSDVGSFNALWDVSEKDKQGNVVVGDVIAEQTSNSYIYAQHKLISTVGVDNLVVVETKDAVLVANKDQVQDVKKIVSRLKADNRKECLQNLEVYQPWGSHEEIAEGDRFLVKHLKLKPGEQTALQKHYHRAEHWIVVQGTAEVTNGEKTYLISENQSTYIPLGSAHRIANPGKVELHLIEVRSGGYLHEDDIVRLEEY